jgi:hypothetical protein
MDLTKIIYLILSHLAHPDRTMKCKTLITCSSAQISDEGITLEILCDGFQAPAEVTGDEPKKAETPLTIATYWENDEIATEDITQTYRIVTRGPEKAVLHTTEAEQAQIAKDGYCTTHLALLEDGLTWTTPGLYTLEVIDEKDHVLFSRKFQVAKKTYSWHPIE